MNTFSTNFSTREDMPPFGCNQSCAFFVMFQETIIWLKETGSAFLLNCKRIVKVPSVRVLKPLEQIIEKSKLSC